MRPATPLRWSDLTTIAGVRLVVSAGVLFVGLRAISDDDYSRVVIAQTWARSPRLDPSGTSWLPFPFWLTGSVMLALGRSLIVAQGVALALGAASSILVAKAAEKITDDRRASMIAACFGSLVAWSAWLGVATVPELLTAALTLYAASTLASSTARDRWLGALALVVATLSRYEPWPVAIAFALWNAVDPPHETLQEGPLPERTKRAIWEGRPARRERSDRAPAGGGQPLTIVQDARETTSVARFGISIVAVIGIASWIGWNRVAHGEALHFVARVTAYRRALGEGAEEGMIARLVAYPAALAREMPEVVVPFVAYVALAAMPRMRAAVLARIRQHRATLALALVQVVALAAALVKDGAPTHHPERAVLFPALAMVVFVADAVAEIARLVRPGILVLLGAALFARAVAIPVRTPWAFARRDSEVEVGRLVHQKTRPDQRVLIEATDYGYFAVEAASGQPEVFELDRDLDPRHPKPPPSFAEPKEYEQYLRTAGFAYLVFPVPEDAPIRLRFERGMVFATARHALAEVPPPQ